MSARPPDEPVERSLGAGERAPTGLIAFPPRPALSPRRHARAAVILLALTVVLGGLAYPAVVTLFAQAVTPSTANGSLLYGPNGTVVGSSLVGQNLTGTPFLFWTRPSPSDYNLTFGEAALPGPSDPALVNETRAYIDLYGRNTTNATLPLWLVSSSGSQVDPDLVPEAVLVQIPRVVTHWPGLTVPQLTAFVNARIQPPPTGFVGTAYVDVLTLDVDLLHAYGRP
jgi:K+-transporting ATPase ATPase C chain